MSFNSWLQNLQATCGGGSGSRTLRRRPRSAPLFLEQLETRLTPSLSTLASFVAPEGSPSGAALIMDSSGNLYGTTVAGGPSGDGSVFELAHGSGTIATLASFNGSNGAIPYGGLILDSSGNLYGTAYAEGASGDGTVFELAQGSSTITTLASFNGPNGANPFATLILDSSGNLYGTARHGGAFGSDGTVFELAQGSGTITTLASFNGTHGASPNGLIMDSSGNFYGTTLLGGSVGGTVFELAHGSGTITMLASFNGTNGKYPRGSVILDGSGNLYGTASSGGPSGYGTVFELAHGSGAITTLASFNFTNGANPSTGLVPDSSGNLYGTTNFGGATEEGTVFELVHDSSPITTLASFVAQNGAGPSGLIMDGSGNLYGTTVAGGAGGLGSVFEITNPAATFAIGGFPAPDTAGAAGPFTVTAENAPGAVNTGYTGTVHFTSSDPQAVLPADYTFTAADQGVHTFSATLDTAGTQSLTAADTTLGFVGTEIGIAVNPAAASTFNLSGYPSPTNAGLAGSLTVTALDSFGNQATGYTGTVHLTSSDPLAAPPADYTFSTTDNGSHTFSATLNTTGTQSLTATDTATGSITGAQTGITVDPAGLPAVTVSVTGFPSSISAGVSGTIIVTARDANGAIAPSYRGTVHFSSSDIQAGLPANYTFTNADQGTHTFGVTLKTAGSRSLTATDTTTVSITGSESGIVVKPAAASQFVISAPSSVTHGVAFSLTLTVEDVYGNVVTGYVGTVHFISSDSTATLPANYTFTSGDAGVHTFSTMTTLRKKGTQTITVTDTLNSSLTVSISTSVA